MHNPKISVVMACFLGEYEYAATDRVRKLHRAVHSFITQTYKNAELIIVADGCDLTIKEVHQHYGNYPNIILHLINKQPMFSGAVRNLGCQMSSGEIIAYLDSDDLLGANHLQAIANGFNHHQYADWVYFNDQVIHNFHPSTREILTIGERDITPVQGTIGTSSIAHKKLPEFNWLNCNGYGHDWTFIKRLIDSKKPNVKIHGCEYRVCHIPNGVDC